MKYKWYYPIEKEMMDVIKEEWDKLHQQYPTIRKYAFVQKSKSLICGDDGLRGAFTMIKYKDIPNSDFVELDYYQIMLNVFALCVSIREGVPFQEGMSHDPHLIIRRFLRHEIRHIIQNEELSKWYNKNVIGILETFYTNLYEEDAVEFETKDMPIDVFLDTVNYYLLKDVDLNMSRTQPKH